MNGPRYASLRHDLSSIGKRARSRLEARGSHLRGTLALEDVSFEVEEGESFALIGPNGAGKSTALKLLTRISASTAGIVRLRGRVAALMEVGSGVHPELTGRENIWLYGGLAVFMGFTLYDVQKILNHARMAQRGLRPKDTVNESISLELDFINIFVRLVQIMSMQQRRK